MKKDLVWYVSYGSNMLRKRFMYYIEGGYCEENDRPYAGCDDKTPPIEDKPYVLKNYKMFFGEKSSSWQGYVSFLKAQEGAEALGRMYLITREQFCDVRCQEGCGSNWYCDTVQLNPDAPDEIPILTITNHNKNSEGQPSEAYRNVIVAGLKETYPVMTQADIEEYLDKCKLGSRADNHR